MEHIIKGVINFKAHAFPERKALFNSLAEQQSPEVLFITCADSRIDPHLITQSHPGDLFVCRNAGNIVPTHSNTSDGMTASIEYGVAVLGVEHIVICGHSNCGAMKGALNLEGLNEVPHVKEWLDHCRGAVEVIKERHGCANSEHLEEMTEQNILSQIQHLKTHPSVNAKLVTGKLKIHGWIYRIETGDIACYDDQTNTFVAFEELYAETISKIS